MTTPFDGPRKVRSHDLAPPPPSGSTSQKANRPDVAAGDRSTSAAERVLKSDNLRQPDPHAMKLPRSARSVLSAAEIEALLRPDLSDVPEMPAGREEGDFEGLELGAGGQKLAIQCSRFLAGLTHALQDEGKLGLLFSVTKTGLGPFRQGVAAVQRDSVFICFANDAGTVGAVLSLPHSAAIAFVERASGASLDLAFSARLRRLTDLDRHVLRIGFGPARDHLSGQTGMRVYGDRAQAEATIPPGDSVRMGVSVQLGARTWPATFFVEPGLLNKAQDQVPVGMREREISASDRIEAREPLEMTAVLTARIASLSVPLSRITALKPGKTLLLGLPADQPVSLLNGDRNGHVVAEGDVGRRGSKLAIRLTEKSPLYRR